MKGGERLFIERKADLGSKGSEISLLAHMQTPCGSLELSLQGGNLGIQGKDSEGHSCTRD